MAKDYTWRHFNAADSILHSLDCSLDRIMREKVIPLDMHTAEKRADYQH